MAKRMSAKVKDMLGSSEEPTFTVLNSDKINLIKGLSYYSYNSDVAHSKAWAIEWAKKNMPYLVSHLSKQKDYNFGTYGFILRMVENGFVLDDFQLQKIKNKLIELAKVKEEQDFKALDTKRDTPTPVNKLFEDFDYAVDDVLKGHQPRTLSFAGADKKQRSEVLEKCQKMMRELEEAPEYFRKEIVKPLKQFLTETVTQLSTVEKAIKKQQVRKTVPKKIVPSKMVSKLAYKKKDDELGLVSLKPELLVGAKQAIVYNTETRQMIYYKASNDVGFVVTGTTLKNIDEKSYLKKIRKPEEMARIIKGLTMAGLKKYLDGVASKELRCSGRFNENVIILKVSG